MQDFQDMPEFLTAGQVNSGPVHRRASGLKRATLQRKACRCLASSIRARIGFVTMKRVLFAGCLVISLMVQSAVAHPVPFSFLDFYLTSSGIEATLVLHDFDVAHDLGISPPERLREADFLAERAPSIRALLEERLQITADGKSLKPEWGKPESLVDR